MEGGGRGWLGRGGVGGWGLLGVASEVREGGWLDGWLRECGCRCQLFVMTWWCKWCW